MSDSIGNRVCVCDTDSSINCHKSKISRIKINNIYSNESIYFSGVNVSKDFTHHCIDQIKQMIISNSCVKSLTLSWNDEKKKKLYQKCSNNVINVQMLKCQ